MYASVRREALARGVRFSSRGAGDYYSYPLMALDDVIASRRIPFRENARWIPQLARAGFTLGDLKNGELQFNYLFHESAHLIAHAEIFGRRLPRRLPKSADTLLGIMVGEAFANMVECLGSAFAEGEIFAYFLDANCHFRASEREVRILRAAGARWGWEVTARVLLGAFLYSNYLFERLSKAELARVAAFAGLPPSAPIGSLARVGLQLHEKFRSVTTPLHLRKLGFGADLPRLFRADPLRLLLDARRARLLRATHALAAVAARDCK